MARPRTDPLQITHPQAACPMTLDAGMRRLWHREFDRFPAGYYVPADVSAMVLYVQTVADHEAALRRVANAKGAAARREERAEVRAIRRQLIVLQRALRMYPVSRAHPVTMGRLAHDLAQQAPSDGDEPAWRRIMREARPTKPN